MDLQINSNLVWPFGRSLCGCYARFDPICVSFLGTMHFMERSQKTCISSRIPLRYLWNWLLIWFRMELYLFSSVNKCWTFVRFEHRILKLAQLKIFAISLILLILYFFRNTWRWYFSFRKYMLNLYRRAAAIRIGTTVAASSRRVLLLCQKVLNLILGSQNCILTVIITHFKVILIFCKIIPLKFLFDSMV